MKRANKVLLDTNIVIALFAGDPAVISRLQSASEVYLPAVVLGELYYGAFGSSRQKQNLERLEALAQRIALLYCDGVIAKRYGEVKARLSTSGKMIPENDVWIASIAIQHDLVLLTRDAHFRVVSGLTTDAAMPQ